MKTRDEIETAIETLNDSIRAVQSSGLASPEWEANALTGMLAALAWVVDRPAAAKINPLKLVLERAASADVRTPEARS